MGMQNPHKYLCVRLLVGSYTYYCCVSLGKLINCLEPQFQDL